MSPRVLAAVVLAGVACTSAAAASQLQWQDVIRNLRHPEADERLEAVEELRRSNHLAAIEPIASLIRDPDDRVQAAALEAELTFFLNENVGDRRILDIGGQKSRAQQAFDSGPLIRNAMSAPPVLIDALIGAMRDANARVRFDAIHTLGFVAEPPLPLEQLRLLAGELDHYDPVMRIATARVLGRLGQRQAGDALTAALQDSNATVRRYVVEALGLIREDRALIALRDRLAWSKGENVDGIVLALARIGSPDDAAMFRQGLNDRSENIRRAAAEGLGRAGDRGAIDGLRRLMMTDRSETVRMAAAFGLQKLGEVQTHTLGSMLILDDEGPQALGYLLELGPAAVPGIHEVFKVATDPRHIADLIQTLGYLGSASDLPTVEFFLKSPDERVVRAATAASARLRRPARTATP
jgi:HEAT repeat protein